NIGSTIRPHDRYFGIWPGVYEISTDRFTVEGNVSPAICLTGDDGYFRNCCFGICVKYFGTMADDSTVFLFHTREKPGDIFKGNQRDIERITKTNKPACLVT